MTRVAFSQTGKGHNAWSPPSLRLEFIFKNHPSAADAQFIRQLALSRERVWCWVTGGFSRGIHEDELPEWLAYDLLREIACSSHKFSPHEESWVLGLDGKATFYEPVPELSAFTRPAAGNALCFLDGTAWCSASLNQLVTV